MEVEMSISNRPKVRKRFAGGSGFRFSLSMTLILGLYVTSAQAQSDGMAKPPSSEMSATAPAAEKSRSRRVEASNATTDNAANEGKTTEASPVEEKGNDRLSMLRVQIETAKTDAERVRLQRTLIDYLVALGKKSEALNELRVMSRAERLDPIGFYNIGNALARLGDTDTAIDAYRKAIKQRHGNYARALNNLGVMLLRQGRWDEAQEALASALRLENFRYSEASYNLGRVHASQGEADLAIRAWTRALAAEPDHADAAIALARAYAEDGSPERGLAILDTFVARHGPSAEMMEARHEVLFGSDPREAKTGIEPSADAPGPAKGANVHPSAPSNTSAPAVIISRESGRSPMDSTARKSSREKSGSSKRAAAALRPLTVDRETYDLLQRARAAREGGRNEEAATLYRRVLSRSNGFFPPANLELSFVLSDLKRHEEAAAALAMIAKRDGARYPIAYYYLGRQYELLGSLSLAAEAFEKAAAAYGDTNPQFLLDISRVREKEGNAQAALAAMESFVRISQSLGRVPDWTGERLAELRQKAAPKK